MEDVILKEAKIISYLTFSIGVEHFALNVGKVINILEMQTITEVPKSPVYMSGVINLRGEVLPVIDSKLKLGLGKIETSANTCILVIEAENKKKTIRFGAIVDAVHEVLEIEDKKILPPPAMGESFETDLITGVVEDNEKFIMILDINRLLESKDIIELTKLKSVKKTE